MLRTSTKLTACKKQRGISLIELMVGIAVALIIMSGVITVFVNISTSSTTSIQMARLNTELRMAVNLMTRELQRSGYVNAWDPAGNGGEGAFRLDELSTFGDITLGDCAGALCNCIVYHYDTPDGANPLGDGTLSGTGDETFGFRHNGGAIEMGTNVSCDSGTNWEDLTSGDINITALTFEIVPADSKSGATAYEIDEDNDNDVCDAGEICLDRRKINIALAGELARDDEVTLSLDTQVKLMNDRYYTK